VIASRVPLAPLDIERLARASRERPTALVALQADDFLDQVPDAAVRIAANDPTPLTRRIVAGRLAASVAARA